MSAVRNEAFAVRVRNKGGTADNIRPLIKIKDGFLFAENRPII